MKAGIIGAGIMGQLLALNLLNAGWEVTVFDRNDDINCSMAAAGLLTPVSELVKNDLIIFELGIEAISQHWPWIINQLQQPIYFQNQGSLLLAHPRDQAELSSFINIIKDKLQNVPDALQQHIKTIKPSELEPDLTKINHGYYFATEGCIDNQVFLKTLQQYLLNQVIWHKNIEVEKIIAGSIIAKNISQSFDMVFDCRGLAAKNRFENLRGVRGELAWLWAPEVNIQRPIRLLHPRYSLYIVPRADATYILGASEIEAEDHSAISVKTLLELLTSAYWLHSGFSEARLIKTVTHCRPTLPDQLPKIKYGKQMIAINGLYRHGFLIAPTLAADILLFLKSGLSKVNYPNLWEQAHDTSAV
ncbi:MAG TPA: FAD-dependent oxidoreductase [Gammaproteobacteria bacterium]|nr:FAD-dependent oxidoreductase [Gammaproteobacteria bacterium]